MMPIPLVTGGATPAHSLDLGGLAFALVIIALSVWSWRGKTPASRWWARGGFMEGVMRSFAPGGGLLLLFVVIGKLLGFRGAPWLLYPVFAYCVVMILGPLGLLPPFWGPKWYRELKRQERASG